MSVASHAPALAKGNGVLWIAAAVLPALLIVGLIAQEDPIAAAIVVGAPLIPYLLYAGIRGAAGDRNFGALLATIILMMLCANFRYRELTDKSLDLQVLMRLVALFGAFGLAAFSIRPIFRNLYLHGLSYWLYFYAFLIFTATYAIDPAHAGFSTFSLLTSFLFLCYVSVNYGPNRLVEIIVWSGLAMCLLSIAFYFAVPSIGRMSDWLNGELVLTSRLQGVFSTANGAGCGCGMLFFLTWSRYLYQPNANRVVAYTTLATSFACMILSNNRMALACLIFSSLVYYVASGQFYRKILAIISLIVLASVPLLLFPDEIFGLLSRSGSADEITSGTGRTRIWAVVLDLVPQAWLLGRGYASAQHILPIHPDLFLAAAHAHNLYLEVLFSGGVIGLGILTWCILTTLVLAARVNAVRELALFSFFIPYGITEPVIGGPTYFALIIWQAAVVLIFHHAKQNQLALSASSGLVEQPRGTRRPPPMRSDTHKKWLDMIHNIGLDMMYAVMRPYQQHTRERRSRTFADTMTLRPGMRVVDLGGSPMIWQFIKTPLDITLVNLTYDPETSPVGKNTEHHKFHHIVGDACQTGLEANSFDMAFSNSVIEHVGDATKQRAFANEIRRLAPRYWVQTPAKWFPIEAHTGMPLWWFYPAQVRRSMISRWLRHMPSWGEMVRDTTLVEKQDLKSYFPDATILAEKSMGFVKSYVAFKN